MTRVLFTPKFWADAIERVIKTAAQSCIGAIGATAMITSLDWGVVGGTVGIAAALSLLTSIASAPVGDSGTGSVISK